MPEAARRRLDAAYSRSADPKWPSEARTSARDDWWTQKSQRRAVNDDLISCVNLGRARLRTLPSGRSFVPDGTVDRQIWDSLNRLRTAEQPSLCGNVGLGCSAPFGLGEEEQEQLDKQGQELNDRPEGCHPRQPVIQALLPVPGRFFCHGCFSPPLSSLGNGSNGGARFVRNRRPSDQRGELPSASDVRIGTSYGGRHRFVPVKNATGKHAGRLPERRVCR